MVSDFRASMGLPSSYETVGALQRPRTIKTHLSYDMLPKQIHEKKAKVYINNAVCLPYYLLIMVIALIFLQSGLERTVSKTFPHSGYVYISFTSVRNENILQCHVFNLYLKVTENGPWQPKLKSFWVVLKI